MFGHDGIRRDNEIQCLPLHCKFTMNMMATNRVGFRCVAFVTQIICIMLLSVIWFSKMVNISGQNSKTIQF